MNDGFYRIAAASPKVDVANVQANTSSIIETIRQAGAAGADILVLPELCVTAYTCADLFHSSTLLSAAGQAADAIAEATRGSAMLVVAGMPVRHGDAVYNCAAVFVDGRIIAAIPKTYIPNYNEFYERRWFAPAPSDDVIVRIGGVSVPMSANIILNHGGVGIGIEICEDLWAPVPASSHLALAGAEVIVNLSASDDLTGKYAYLRSLVSQQSARSICAYAYASAGFGESSTDLVFDSKLLIAENGHMLAANSRWQDCPQMIVSDVDIEAIRRDRLHNTTFHTCARRNSSPCSIIDCGGCAKSDGLLRKVNPHPFVPAENDILADRCEEIVNIQVAALAKRLAATHCRCLVVGVSGGLDSTLALLVAARAFDRLKLDRKGIVGVTMPGFGTTDRTHTNAIELMDALGVESREISINAAVSLHFEDIGHDPSVHNVTYENSQARERTQILMDLANSLGGMVLGTGDLSELALGWATYNGDHMSMYAVNAGVPKTLVRYLTRYFADITDNAAERACLLDIVDTPISPELIPAEADGTISQKTEDLVGPYDLHDFFLYYTLRYGFTPARIYRLACLAFDKQFDSATILKWERTFFRRFFNQQFKRSCLPDGPKVGSVCLSPRGDWRMPSDASSSLWLAELDNITPQ